MFNRPTRPECGKKRKGISLRSTNNECLFVSRAARHVSPRSRHALDSTYRVRRTRRDRFGGLSKIGSGGIKEVEKRAEECSGKPENAFLISEGPLREAHIPQCAFVLVSRRITPMDGHETCR